MTLIGARHVGGRARRPPTPRSPRPTSCSAAARAPRTRCCRPPGHHVTRSAYGGSCYLNNAAIAAAHLRAALGGPVAVIDVDAHHGNGAQAIFYDDPGVLTGSVHVDPAARLVPALPRRRRRARRRAPTATCRSRPAAATRPGSPPCTSWRGGRPARSRGRWSSRSASTRRRAIRRARSPSPPTASARRAARSARSGCRRSSCRRAATTSTPSARSCGPRWRGSTAGQHEEDTSG